ncbi:hypothetical protein [Halocola ammonii]
MIQKEHNQRKAEMRKNNVKDRRKRLFPKHALIILMFSFLFTSQSMCQRSNAHGPLTIEFEYLSSVLSEEAKSRIIDFTEFFMDQDGLVLVLVNSCIWEHEIDPMIGWRRAQIIRDFILAKHKGYSSDDIAVIHRTLEETYGEKNLSRIRENSNRVDISDVSKSIKEDDCNTLALEMQFLLR